MDVYDEVDRRENDAGKPQPPSVPVPTFLASHSFPNVVMERSGGVGTVVSVSLETQ